MLKKNIFEKLNWQNPLYTSDDNLTKHKSVRSSEDIQHKLPLYKGQKNNMFPKKDQLGYIVQAHFKTTTW